MAGLPIRRNVNGDTGKSPLPVEGAGYFGRLAASTEPLIIANENQKPDIDANYGELYSLVPSSQKDGTYELRPGVKLLLYQRRKGFTPSEPPSIRRP